MLSTLKLCQGVTAVAPSMTIFMLTAFRFGGGDLARSALALLAVGAILLTPGEAWAAKSGGRVGGSSFRSSPQPQQRQQRQQPQSKSYNTTR